MFKRINSLFGVFAEYWQTSPSKGGGEDLRSVAEGVKVGLQFAGVMKETCLVGKPTFVLITLFIFSPSHVISEMIGWRTHNFLY